MNTKTDLALFQFTQPDLLDGMSGVSKQTDSGSRSITLTLETRKAVAARLNLTMNKDNAAAIDTEILRMKDAMKTVGIAEVVKAASSPLWTGGALRISQNKAGDKSRMTFSLVSVNRNGHSISEDQLVKAMANMTEDQQVAIMEKAEAIKRATPAVEA